MPFVAKRVFGWEPVEITDAWGLRDIRPGMAYTLCGSVQCLHCGVLFLDIRFSEREMMSLYSGYRNDEYVALREQFEPGYAARQSQLAIGSNYISKVERFLSDHLAPPSSVLDWGGDIGLNTPYRSTCQLLHVHDISGLQPSGKALQVQRDVIDATHYDLIVLSNVLEHVPFPGEVLSEVQSAMSVDSVLYIEVPHEDLVRSNPKSRDLYARKKYWHEHINFFTQESLEHLLRRRNLNIEGMKSILVTAGGKEGYVFMIACRSHVDRRV